MYTKFDWENIDTVLLDMDGTVLDLNFDTTFWLHYLPAVWGEKNNLELSQAKAKLAPEFAKYAGTLNWYSVDFWSHKLGLDVMLYKQDLAHLIQYRPRVESFLKYCRQCVDDVRLVTNAHRRVLDMKHNLTGINDYFSEAICSHELEFPKEDPLFWPALNKRAPYQANRTLLIDDTDSVLESAQQFGIKHLFSIAKPDSQRDRIAPSRFEMLECF